MHEIVVNLHMHTRYSDGSGTHRYIATAALKAGVDVVIVTDHNVLVNGFEGYYKEKNKKILTSYLKMVIITKNKRGKRCQKRIQP